MRLRFHVSRIALSGINKFAIGTAHHQAQPFATQPEPLYQSAQRRGPQRLPEHACNVRHDEIESRLASVRLTREPTRGGERLFCRLRTRDGSTALIASAHHPGVLRAEGTRAIPVIMASGNRRERTAIESTDPSSRLAIRIDRLLEPPHADDQLHRLLRRGLGLGAIAVRRRLGRRWRGILRRP